MENVEWFLNIGDLVVFHENCLVRYCSMLNIDVCSEGIGQKYVYVHRKVFLTDFKYLLRWLGRGEVQPETQWPTQDILQVQDIPKSILLFFLNGF